MAQISFIHLTIEKKTITENEKKTISNRIPN